MKFYNYSTDNWNGYRLCVAQPVADGGHMLEAEGPVCFFWEVLQSSSDGEVLDVAGECLPFRPADANAVRLWLLRAVPHCDWAFLTSEGECPDVYDWQYLHAVRLDILTRLADRMVVTSERCYDSPDILTENATTFYVRA